MMTLSIFLYEQYSLFILPVNHVPEESGMLVHQISVYPDVKKNLSIYLSIISLPVNHGPEETGMIDN